MSRALLGNHLPESELEEIDNQDTGHSARAELQAAVNAPEWRFHADRAENEAAGAPMRRFPWVGWRDTRSY